ncbi:MAG: hypothetical protein JW881_11035 [Spirochaetales bacterium]|nr:hypothetical protein [Spirochaetales bacterium]
MSISLVYLLFVLNITASIDTPVYYPVSREPAIPAIERLDDFDAYPASPKDEWFGMDKFWHWLFSFSLTGSAYQFFHHQLHIADPEAAAVSLSSAFTLGILKECYDLWTYDLFSYKDLIYDILGIATGYVVFILDWRL